MLIKRPLITTVSIFLGLFISGWIWLIDFNGLQSIRFYCYDYRFCYQVAQVIENPFWQKFITNANTKLFDPLFWPLTLNKKGMPKEKMYKIIISEKSLKALINNLPTDTREYLTSKYKKKQPAALIYMDQSIPIKVHFRGISYNHWIYPEKSWKVYVSSPIEPQGERVLNFVLPNDKDFFAYFAAASYAKTLDITLPQSDVAYLSINNGHYTPYLLLESIDSDFLERRGKIVGPLFRDRDPYPNMPALYDSIERWEISNADSIPQTADFAPITSLIDAMKLDDDTFAEQLPKIVDMESFYKWNILAILINNKLEDDYHNVLVYFNPTSGKLEFLPSDISVDIYRTIKEAELPTFDQPYNPLVSRILSIPDFKTKRDQILWSFIKNRGHLNRALAAFDESAGRVTPYLLLDNLKNYSNLNYLVQTKKIKQALEVRFNHIYKVLSTQYE